MSKQSCIYHGRIRHRRFSDGPREFEYSMFMMYLDLDELDTVFENNSLWSVGRRNLAWLSRNDYIGPHELSIKEAVGQIVLQRTGAEIAGPVRMLSHLRYFGHCFNPVSFYYCFDRAGEEVEFIVAEINNTPWGERHSYVLPVKNRGANGRLECSFPKEFHVSPFWPMEQDYLWRFTLPTQSLVVHMENFSQRERVFDATLTLRREEASAKNLNRILLRFPFMTLKVVSGIYWQALRLKLGGATFYPHPHSE